MATLDYVEIPPYATRLQDSPRQSHKIVTSLPNAHPNPHITQSPTSPTKAGGLNMFIPQILLSSTLHIPDSPTQHHNSSTTSTTTPLTTGASARKLSPNVTPLLSRRDPLSIPTTTVNFKRFVSKSGPVFWFQDRVEEVVMWRRGWKVTGVWMCVYAFLCYFPRMILLIPHTILISIILSTHPSASASTSSSSHSSSSSTPAPAHATEGTIDWQANIQGIQNLMGFLSDIDDLYIHPYLPYITHHHSSSHNPSPQIVFVLAVTSFAALLFLLPVLPLRTLALVGGWGVFAMTHPFVRGQLVPRFLELGSGRGWRGWNTKKLRMALARKIDDDRLEDRHWASELREVELWENERWSASATSAAASSSSVDGASGSCSLVAAKGGGGGWGKSYLRTGSGATGERSAWTRRRDGWSGVGEDGSGDVSTLTFALPPHWSFVETEDWRTDLQAEWADGAGSDDNGWVYTNDVWLDPHSTPLDIWKGTGMTRRRRWIRRIYYSPPAP